MSYFNTTRQNGENGEDLAIDPFSDPVAFLAGLGIEAELVETTTLYDAA